MREASPRTSGDEKVLAPFNKAFQATGGLKVLSGNLGHAVIKTSAVKPERRMIEAPAKVFDSQQGLNEAFKAGTLTGDFIAVIRFQGPKANGMPELHKLTTVLGILQDRGQRVALVTDGRMSGASGKVPAAIHVTPEAVEDGAIARIHDGDVIRLGGDKSTVRLVALETPGHTAESISMLVFDETRSTTEPYAVLTGDTLFVGDVGRPDLRVALGWSAGELGGLLYDSLRTKLMTLPDSALVYPAHGAGSLCGKALGKETFSTIGEQRRSKLASALKSK